MSSYVWVYQEKTKGNRQDYYLPVPGFFHTGSTYGGWGFNVYDGYLPSYPIWYVPLVNSGCRRVMTPAEIGTVTQKMLDGSRYNPLFKSGWGNYNSADPTEIVVDVNASDFTGPSWIMGLYDPVGGNTIAADPVKRNQLLAEAIPALSKPVGANLCQNRLLSEKQFNMPVQFIVNGSWPPTSFGILPGESLPP